MTEGQWLWLLTHMSVDDDEQMASLCVECLDNSKINKCSGCGKNIDDMSINESFDNGLFEKLKSKSRD